MSERFLLILGDDENKMFEYAASQGFLRDICLNFENSPSIAMIYDVALRDVKDVVDDVRANGMKVGVYSTLEKAQGFMFKTMALSDDGTMEEPKMITLGEVKS